jgi:alanine racemase
MSRTATAILSTENLLHNLGVIKNLVGPAKIIAMVKANAYGHGIRSVGLRLNGRVDMMGAASIDEALTLRKAGVKTDILLAEGVFEPGELLIAATEKLHVVFHNQLQLEWLDKSALPLPLHTWIKIRTGMGRLGFSPKETRAAYQRLLDHAQTHKPIRVMSHLACADEKDHPLNAQQIDTFNSFIEGVDSEFSLCNSAGIFNFPAHHYNYVRPGLALYGISPLPEKSASDLGLKPVMTLQSSLIAVQHFEKGDSIGYGARYICNKDMPVGIIAFGYGDGYPFTTKDGTPVLVRNTVCPVVGRISMDMMAVDLSACTDAQIGDPVLLWGDKLSLEHIAKHTDSIPWNIITGIQNRVKFLWTPL